VTVARDVKLQIDFNPAQVGAYRLIGYENRMLEAPDFADDRKDAGEIGAGHTVTAFYEVIPAGLELELPNVDPLKYQITSAATGSDELLTVKLRYKEPEGDTSKLIEVPAVDAGKGLAEASDDFIFSASVASFGMLLRESQYQGLLTMGGVEELAESARGKDPNGHRGEFVELVRKAEELREMGK
jgi:Ca-activated chloride channel family protein